MNSVVHRETAGRRARPEGPDLTGIPGKMRRRFEENSGLSFQDVRVHYSSPLPEQVQAKAFTSGTQVFIGPGQERWLSHELGHVIQQKRGRVAPTVRVNGHPVNDSGTLEREADALGRTFGGSGGPVLQRAAAPDGVIQRGGEQDAVAATKTFRRGNRRGSVVETKGNSRKKLDDMRTWMDNTLWPSFYHNFIENDVTLQGSEVKLYHFVYAEVIKIVQAANCGEYAFSVFAHLADHGGGAGGRQWVYKCSMVKMVTDPKTRKQKNAYDHAFNITSSHRYGLGMLPAGVDQDEATVVDAWNNYKISTLKQFCQGQNPYRHKLKPAINIEVEYMLKARNRPTLTPEMETFIQTEAMRFLQTYQQVAQTEAEIRTFRGVFNFSREGRETEDTRHGRDRRLDPGDKDFFRTLDSALTNEEEWQELVDGLTPERKAIYGRHLLDKGYTAHLADLLDSDRQACFVFLDLLETERFAEAKIDWLNYKLEYGRKKLMIMDRSRRCQFLNQCDRSELTPLMRVLGPKKTAEYAEDLVKSGRTERAAVILNTSRSASLWYLASLRSGDPAWTAVYPKLLYGPEFAAIMGPDRMSALVPRGAPGRPMGAAVVPDRRPAGRTAPLEAGQTRAGQTRSRSVSARRRQAPT